LKLSIDTDRGILTHELNGNPRTLQLYSDEAFAILSNQWLRVGWGLKYSYRFSWLGRPLIQLPQDVLRLQEIIYQIQPDVIIETGVAHGGSLILYATICKAINKGRIIGVDIEIRPHNRVAIESHPLSSFVTLVEGSSTDHSTVNKVHSLVKDGETVLVILDSCHSKDHVRKELESYCDLVSPGSYLIVADGIMKDLSDVPQGNPDWETDHPVAAAKEFCDRHPEFVLDLPAWSFNESSVSNDLTYFPDGWLRRVY
jgi:cephalosporin hydroxylase